MNKPPDYLREDNLATVLFETSMARRTQERRNTSAYDDTMARRLSNSDPDIDSVQDQQPEGHTEWLQLVKSVTDRTLELEEWYSECALWGHDALRNSVEIDPGRRSGVPVLKGTRFTVGQTLSELAESAGVPEVAAQFDLDEKVIRDFLYGLALLADKPRP
jgi:uncharacterized protein (DUF433 family)